jgi:hypothetical protein
MKHLDNKILKLAEKQIRSTGYSESEIARIEDAFEYNSYDNDYDNDSNEDTMFKGLMAVIDVLDEIHENKDEQTTKRNKQRFTTA